MSGPLGGVQGYMKTFGPPGRGKKRFVTKGFKSLGLRFDALNLPHRFAAISRSTVLSMSCVYVFFTSHVHCKVGKLRGDQVQNCS